MQPREVTIFGAGYVGLVTGACLASSGHTVTVVDSDSARIEALERGRLPFHEPELPEMLADCVPAGRLSFAHASRIPSYGEFLFVAVGTPSTATGAADLRFVRSVLEQVRVAGPRDAVVVMKSTVPPGTGAAMAELLAPAGLGYVSNPEFLREGTAVHDWRESDRIVLGGDPDVVARVAELYDDIDAPVCACDIASAELIKYASNAFLATKISYANEIAHLCDDLGADVDTVLAGVGADRRIGPAFLKAGLGYGGSCFPKDTRALDHLSHANGYEFHLLKAVIDVNTRQRRLPVEFIEERIGDLDGVRVAVLGLTFKPNTDDTRESPAIDVISMLLERGASVRAFDPVGHLPFASGFYAQTATLEGAVRDAAAAVVATEWPQICAAPWDELVPLMSEPRIVFDGRNCVDPGQVTAAGGVYAGVGRR